MIQGKVSNVTIDKTGDWLAVASAANATQFTCYSVGDFDEDGGTLTVDGGTTSFSYDSLDTDNNIIFLSAPYATALAVDTEVRMYPLSEEKWALVEVDDDEDGLSALIPYSMSAMFEDGIRDEDLMETVAIEIIREQWEVTNLISMIPEIDGAYIPPDSLPLPPPPPPTDGLPPTLAVTIKAIGGIGAIFVQWTPVFNPDPLTYKVYMGEAAGFPATSPNLVGSTMASQLTIRTEADGTALLYTNPDNTPKLYYFRVIATDADPGQGPDSNEVSASMMAVTGPDIAANYVYAGNIFASQIAGGTISSDITIAGSFSTALAGQRTVIDSAGFRQYGPDGVSVINEFQNDPTQQSRLNAWITALGLTVQDGLELRGQKNIMAMGSKLTLQATTSGSATVPGATVDWEVSPTVISEYLYQASGMHMDTGEANRWACLQFFNGATLRKGPYLWQFPVNVMADGSNAAEFKPVGGTRVNNATGDRAIIIGEVRPAGWSGLPNVEIRSYDDAGMTNSVAPIKKLGIPYASFNWWYAYALGRCFTNAGTTRKNTVALARYDSANNQIQVRTITCEDSGFVVGPPFTIASPLDSSQNEQLCGVAFGSSTKMGFQGTDFDVWVIGGSFNNYVYSNSSFTRVPDLDFPSTPGQRQLFSIGNLSTNTFDGFRSIPAGDNIQMSRYTNMSWNAVDSSNWWVGYTWKDSNPAGAGQWETNVSTLTPVTMKKRAQLTVTVPPLPDPAAGHGAAVGPDDVNSFRLYMARGASRPTNAQLWRQTTQPADLATAVKVTTMPVWTGVVPVDNPPVTTTFPTQSAAVIESSAQTGGVPNVRLSADGSAHFQALDVTGDGASSLSGKAFEQLYYSIRAQSQMAGGGIKACDTSWNISWSQRFICVSMGNSDATFPSGFHEIYNPKGTATTARALTANVVRLTMASTAMYRPGDRVRVSGYGAPFDGDWTIKTTTTAQITYDVPPTADVGSVSSAGLVQTLITGHGGAPDVPVPTNGVIPLNAWYALWYELPYGRGAVGGVGEVTVSNKALTSNVVTLTVSSVLPFSLGDRVTVAIGDPVFDGTALAITGIPTANQIQYAKTNANVASTAATGFVRSSGYDTLNNNFHIVHYLGDFIVPNNWVLIAIRNADLQTTEWVTGEQIDAGFDSDSPVLKQLILNSTADASTAASNKPALRIGLISGLHLRVDGNEIIAMNDNNTQGGLSLNNGGTVNIGNGSGGQVNCQNISAGNSMHGGANGLFADDLTGTTVGVNVNTNGRLVKASSARKYKKNITPLPDDIVEKVLAVEPVSFKWDPDAEPWADDPTLVPDNLEHGGVIADQALEAGLDLWVIKDTEGNVESFDYPGFTSALLKVIQSMDERIKELEGRD